MLLILSSCAATTISGDAGCTSYSEARLTMPAPETITDVPDGWRRWIVETDTRMTGTCTT